MSCTRLFRFVPLRSLWVLWAVSGCLAAEAEFGLAQVRQVPAINGGGTVEGSLQMMSGGPVTLNGGATIRGDLLVPGMPVVRSNGKPAYGGTVDGTGPASPSGYTITLNGQATLRNVIRRTAPLDLPSIPPPPVPVGNREVTLNSPGQPLGDWATLRHLTLNGSVGQIAVPPGTYGDFIANGGSGFTLGIAGGTTPVVYNLQYLTLNGQARIDVVGPVTLNLAHGLAANGALGAAAHPEWLALNLAAGGLTLNGGCTLHAYVAAPAAGSGSVVINGDSTLVGGLVADKLIVNGGGLLRLRAGGPTPDNTAPVAESRSLSTPEDTPLVFTLGATDADGDALTYFLVSAPPPEAGALTLADGASLPALGAPLPAASLRYTPAPDSTEAVTLAFRVRDPAGLESNLATIAIAVTPVNDAPTAHPFPVHTAEDIPIELTLSGDDPEGSSLAFDISTAPANGSLTGIAPHLTYRPNPNFFGSDTFAYTATDDAGAVSAPALVSITVDPVNDAPVAQPQTLDLLEDATGFFIDLPATDVENQVLFRALVSLPRHGVLTLADGSGIPAIGDLLPDDATRLLYIPNPNYHGSDSFSFTAGDGVGTSEPAAISLTILPIDDAPVATPTSAAMPEDTEVTIVLSGADEEGRPLGYAIATPPTRGTVSLTGNLATYRPAADTHGTDEFTFTVFDGVLGSEPALVSITIDPVNDAPVAIPPLPLSTLEDTPIEITLAGADLDGDALALIITAAPTHGALALVSGDPLPPTGVVLPAPASLLYRPASDYHGPDSFQFSVIDSSGASSAVVSVPLTITSVNDDPVAHAAAYAVAERQTLPLVLIATDVDGDLLTYELTSRPALGTLEGDAPAFTYTPPANTDATVAFTFTAFDGAAHSAPATITIEVRNVPDAPIAHGQTLELAEDTSLNLTLTAADPENAPLAYEILVPPAHGMLTFADGSALPLSGSPLLAPSSALTYTPGTDFAGTDTFTFIARDASLESAPAVVTLIVAPVNDAPIALPQNLSAVEGETLTISLQATDADGAELTYTLTSLPAAGTLTFANGAEIGSLPFAFAPGESPVLRYAPPTNADGVFSFAFAADDGLAVSAPASVLIAVTNRNDAPVAHPASVEFDEDGSVVILLSAIDPDAQSLSYAVASQPAHGTVTLDGHLATYVPSANYHGTDAFSFVATDSGIPADPAPLGSAPASVSLTIHPVNDAPTAVPQSLTVIRDTALTITLRGADVDGDALSPRVVVAPLHGSISLQGSLATYTPATGYLGADRFAFVVSDGQMDSEPVEISLTIRNFNAAPVVAAGMDQDIRSSPRADGAPTGRIVVNNDEWVITDTGFQNSSYAGRFARNIADFLTGGKPGARFFAYTKTVSGSVEFAYTGNGFGQVMAQAGHTLVKSPVFPANLVEMLQYDAIFLSANIVDNQLLIDYVEAGGSIYLSAGTKWCGCDAHIEAGWWNAFLNHFGLNYALTYNQVAGTLPLASTHPLLAGIGSLYFGNGNSITLLTDENGETDPYAQIVYTSGPHGLLAVYGNQANQYFLRGTASDDGKPTPPGALSFTWEQISGPTAVIESPHTLVTRVTFGASGVYRFRLTATDGELASADEVEFSLNQAPVVDAGAWQILPQAGLPTTLEGAADDDGVRDPLVVAWSKLAGPGAVTFSAPASPSTTAQVDAPGIYLLQLSAYDGLVTSRDTTELRVGLSTWSAPGDLVAWWPFNESLADQVTGGYRYALTSLPQYVPARVSLGLAFDSDDDGFTLPVGTSLNLGDFAAGFTVEFWASVPASGFGTLLSFGAPNLHGLVLRQSATDIVADLRDSATGTTRTLISGAVPTASTWFHVTLTYDRLTGEGRLYIDGVLRRAQSWAPFSNRTNGSLVLGRNAADGQSFWRGALDELSFYRRPLGVAAVQALYRSGGDGKATSTQNVPPQVNAGPDKVLASVSDEALLAGSFSDDGLPLGQTSVSWRQVSGPGTAIFASPASAQTSVRFDQPGLYQLQLVAHDGYAAPSTDHVEVRVGVVTAANSANLTAWWPLNAHPREVVNGGHDLELMNGTDYAEGRIAQGLGFDGLNDFARTPAHADLDVGASAAGFTIELWCRPEILRDTVALEWGSSATTQTNLAFVNIGRTPRLALMRADGTTANVDTGSATGPDAMVAGQWQHIAATYDRATGLARLYRDGVLLREQSVGVTAPRTSLDLYLGGRPRAPLWYPGSLDEPSLYSRPLSATEIGALFVAGSVGKTPVGANQAPACYAGPDLVLPSATQTALLLGTVSDDGLPLQAGPVLAWQKISGPGTVSFADPALAQTTATFGAPGIYVLALVAYDGLLTATDHVEVRVGVATTANPANLAAWWPLNAHPREVVNGGHDLELMNGADYAEGRVAQGLRFDGLNDFARTLAHADLNVGASAAGFTIELWCRPEILRDTVALEWGNTTTTQTHLFFNNGGTTPRFVLTRADGSNVNVDSSGNLMIAGQWQHVVATYNRATGFARLYRNGVLLKEQSVGVTAPRTNLDLYLGGRPRAPILYPGSLDEPSLYSRPLSATEIAALFLAGSTGKSPIPENRAPVIVLPATQETTRGVPVLLEASVTDDGLPSGSTLVFDWSPVSGPAVPVFSTPGLSATSATFPVAGEYVVAFTASDSRLTATGETRVTVAAPLPVVSLIEPGDGVTVPAKLPLTLRATASYADGAIAKVEFFAGATKLGERTAPEPDTGDYKLTVPAGLAAGAHALTAKVTTADGATRTSAAVNVTATLVAPVVALTFPADGTSVLAQTPLTLTAEATIAAGSIERVEFYRGTTFLGVALAPTLPSSSTFIFNLSTGLPVGSHVLTARAIALGSGATTASPPVAVTAAVYSGPEAVELAAPIDGARLTAPTEVTGIVARAGLASWELEYRLVPAEGTPDSAAPWTTLAGGTDFVGTPATGPAPAVPAALGTFDPTLLLNGLYQLRLSASSTDGTILTTAPVTVLVEGSMKVGAFSVAFNDLVEQTPGLPVTLTRTYDSRDRRVGDFGPGWHLSLGNIRVQKSTGLAYGWEQMQSGQVASTVYHIEPTRAHRIAITMPDGEIHRFEAGIYVPRDAGPALPDNYRWLVPIDVGRLVFHSIGDTTSTLVLDEEDTFAFSGLIGEEYLTRGYPGADPAHEPTRFRLTTADGTVMILDEHLGLLELRDRIGNRLVIHRHPAAAGAALAGRIAAVDSIQAHAFGPITRTVEIARHLDGRVDYLTDLAGRTLDYLYDPQGRLASFTDREANTTQFRYEKSDSPAHPLFHYLTRIIDPRGLPALRCEYDDDGRLRKQIDADGLETVFDRGIDTTGRYERITDRLGRATTYFYDERGNVLTKIDPLGAVTTFAYYPDSDRVKYEEDHYGNVKGFAYDARGNVTVEILGASRAEEPATATTGYTTRTSYTDFSAPLTITDPDGRLQSFTYDPDTQQLLTHTVGQLAPGTPPEIVAPAPATTTYTYHPDGSLWTVTDALGNVTTTTYAYSFSAPVYPGAVKRVTTTVVDPAGAPGSDPANATATTLRTSYSYHDAQENLLATVTPRTLADGTVENAPTRHVYDAENRLRFTLLPDGRISETRYTSFGQTDKTLEWPVGTDLAALVAAGPTGPTDGARVTSHAYDARGHLERTTLPDGTFTATGYDAEGRPVWRQDARGHRSFTLYDEVGRPRFAIQPDVDDGLFDAAPTSADDSRLANNPRSETIYDLVGRVRFQIDEEGATTEFTYDDDCGCAMRRKELIQHHPAGNLVTSYDYYPSGQIRSVTDPRQNTVATRYDSHGRPVRTLLPATDEHPATETATTYNVLGQRVVVADQEEKLTRYRYDALGRLVEVRQYLDQAAASSDVNFNLAPSSSNVVSTTFGYDEAGNQTAQTDARGHATRYEHDALGRRLKRTLPATAGAAKFEQLRYDAWGDLWQRDDFAGHTTTFAYDPLHRLTSKAADPAHPSLLHAHAIARVEYDYDANGSREAARTYNALGTLLHVEATPRDERGRIDHKDTGSALLDYDYHANGLLKDVVSSTEGGVNLGYRYDELNRLAFVDDASRGLPLRTTSYAYTANGSLTAMTYANGLRHAYGYDSLNRLRHLDVGTGPSNGSTVTGVVQSYDYRLRASGHRREVVETGTTAAMRTVNYAYDELYRLTGETIAVDPLHSGSVGYTLDKVGNREARTSTLAPVAPISGVTFNARDQLSTDSYDANGNTTVGQAAGPASAPAAPDVYDFEDRLVLRTRADLTKVYLAYDADGIRIGKTIHDASSHGVSSAAYLICTNNLTGYAQVLEERTTDANGTTLKTYAYGSDLVSETTTRSSLPATRYFVYDGGGSVRALADENGAITDRYTYDAFGVLIAHQGTSDNAYLYRGEQYDADLGLYSLRARFYNPDSGRFWNQDTYEGSNSDPASLHKYLYAHANPVSFIDPTGHWTLAEIKVVATTIGINVAIAAPRVAFFVAEVAGVSVVGAGAARGIVAVGSAAERALPPGLTLGQMFTTAVKLPKGVAIGSYKFVKEILRGTGKQANHINQKAAFPLADVDDALSVGLQGGTHMPGSEHWRFHRVLEDFWEGFRNNPFVRPTNAQYDDALREALEATDLPPGSIDDLVELARQSRAAKYFDGPGGLQPVVPGPIPMAK